MDNKECEPFLPSSGRKFEIDHESHATTSALKSHNRRQHITKILTHVGVFITYCMATTYMITKNTSGSGDEQAFAGLAVKHKFQLYDKFNESPFAGPPSDAVDDAWHNLMLNMSVRVSKEELESHGQSSVELPNGGYLAWLGVFHELHCVKMLRQWSYKDHYHPNMTAHDSQHLMVHIDHCIDWLRNAAMCHADTSALAVFKWDKGPHPMLNTKRVVHKCVDWDLMMGSHRDRLVEQKEVLSLRNPNLMDEGQGNEVGE